MPRFGSSKKHDPIRSPKDESNQVPADTPSASMSDMELKTKRKVKLLGHEVKVPNNLWKRKHVGHHEPNHDSNAEPGDSHQQYYWAEATMRAGSEVSPEPTPRSLSSSATANGGGVGGGSKYSRSGSQPLEEPVKISKVIQDTLHLSAVGTSEVARMQARIDDMWAEEVVLGCECEIFGAIRAAALTAQAGAQEDAAAAVREAALAAAEAEAAALQTVRSRLAARDCVLFEGGLEGLQTRLRRRIRETQSGIQPYIRLLQDRDRAAEVVRIMDRLLRETQDEYASVNAMKTAKSEVVLELQDKASEKEWLQKQLAIVLDNFEASSLLTLEATSQDLEEFFRETVSGCEANCSLRHRAVRCLEQIRLLGNAATSALAALTSVEVDDTDSGHVPEQGCVVLAFPASRELQTEAGIQHANKSLPSRLEAAAAAAAEAIASDSKSHASAGASAGSPISLSSMTAAPSPSKGDENEEPKGRNAAENGLAVEDEAASDNEVAEKVDKEQDEKDHDEKKSEEKDETMFEENRECTEKKQTDTAKDGGLGAESERDEPLRSLSEHEGMDEAKGNKGTGNEGEADSEATGQPNPGALAATGEPSPTESCAVGAPQHEFGRSTLLPSPGSAAYSLESAAEHTPTAAFLAPTSQPRSAVSLSSVATQREPEASHLNEQHLDQAMLLPAASPAGSPPALSMSAISYDCLDEDEEASEECRDSTQEFL